LATFLGSEEDLKKLKNFIIDTIKEIQEIDFSKVVEEHGCKLCEKREI